MRSDPGYLYNQNIATSHLASPSTSKDLKDIIPSLNIIHSAKLLRVQSWNFFHIYILFGYYREH